MDTALHARPIGRIDASGDVGFKMIGGLAASCFIGALVTDIVYARDPDMVWVTFSVWAITAGLLLAGAAALVGLVARVVRRRLPTLGRQWPYLLGFIAVIVVEFVNAFVHSRGAYQAVVPEGITLSIVAVVLLLLTGIAGRRFVRPPISRTF